MRKVTAWDAGKPLWEVVGGAQKGGVVVREGEATTSQELDGRLCHGAWVQEEELRGVRLLYTRLVGCGPASGWVSVRLKDQELLARRDGPPPCMAEADLAAGRVLHQTGILDSAFGHLRLPWEGSKSAAVCRTWRSFFESHTHCWAQLRLVDCLEMQALPALLLRAGSRLRTLDLSAVGGRGLGAKEELGQALRSCKELEDLNVAGWDELSLERFPDVLNALSRSLRRLNIRGCSALHAQLPAMLGSKLQRLEAGWLGENDDERDWKEWTSIFPSHVFRHICERCPSLEVLKFPGYALYSGQPEGVVRALLSEYADIARVGSLRQLKRLSLTYAQLLEDPAISRIASGCKRLRTLNLRCCDNVTDRGLSAVADNLGGSLAHINISCCQFSERAVRKLVIRCRGLRSLDLCYCKGLGPGLMSYLCADPTLCPELRMIGAGGMDLGDEEVGAICTKYGNKLEDLGIGSAARLTDAGLQLLSGLPHLRKLSAHQLQNVSAPALTRMCVSAPRLECVDAGGCEYRPVPTEEQLQALERCLQERPYDYDVSDDESDSEEAEKARLKKEREEKEKADRERRKQEKADREEKAQSLLLAMETEMQSLLP